MTAYYRTLADVARQRAADLGGYDPDFRGSTAEDALYELANACDALSTTEATLQNTNAWAELGMPGSDRQAFSTIASLLEERIAIWGVARQDDPPHVWLNLYLEGEL